MTLGGRLSSLWREKLALTFALNLWVCVPYFWLQRHVFFPVTPMPSSRLDALIPFDARWVWPYESLYLLTPIAPLLMTSRRGLLRYALGLAAVSFACDLIFAFHPTTVARPDQAGLGAAYRFVVSVDRPLNAFPSLHVALAAYSALCCEPLLRIPVLTWVVFIIYATLATRQHVAADAAAGLLLGVSAYFTAFSGENHENNGEEGRGRQDAGRVGDFSGGVGGIHRAGRPGA